VSSRDIRTVHPITARSLLLRLTSSGGEPWLGVDQPIRQLLFQVVVPLVFFSYFVWHEKPFSAAIVLFWVGQSITDVSVYAADASVMQLPLLSGVTGSEGGFHDWNYLLTETGLLRHTNLIANLLRFFGTATIILASLGAFLYAKKGESVISDFDDF
jgi:hypothetical protein